MKAGFREAPTGWIRPVGAVALCLALAAPAEAVTDRSDGPAVERLRYRWRVRGLEGFLAWLVLRVPVSGEGVLTTWQEDDGRLRCEFRATSPAAARGDHWTYTARVDLRAGRTLSVAEALRYRGKTKDKSADLAGEAVVDGVALLQLVRRGLPERARRFEIWSRSRSYPVIVAPGGREVREIRGREETLRRFTVRGVSETGRRLWTARGEIWFAEGEPALPVEIRVRRPLGSARLVLVR